MRRVGVAPKRRIVRMRGKQASSHSVYAHAMWQGFRMPASGADTGIRNHRRHHLRQGTLHQGIIPAPARNTRWLTRRRTFSRDHPRACEEHIRDLNARANDAGSSPRLRGTPRRAHDARRPQGIIPALAGNTDPTDSMSYASRDHPRACGEHDCCVHCRRRVLGSSPRLRGTLAISRSGDVRPGIIPALAGNTRAVITQCPLTWDHPRACGEHAIVHGTGIEYAGSSPRLRGTQVILYRELVRLGIIPALAGNTYPRY